MPSCRSPTRCRRPMWRSANSRCATPWQVPAPARESAPTGYGEPMKPQPNQSNQPPAIDDVDLADRSNFNTREHLRNAERQATERGYEDILIVDVDAHHIETANYHEIFKY